MTDLSEQFKAAYLEMARAVTNGVREKRYPTALFGLGNEGGWPRPEQVLKDAAVKPHLDKLLGFQLKGLHRSAEYNPVYSGLAEALISFPLDITKEESILIITERLLYPMIGGAILSQGYDEENLARRLSFYFDLWYKDAWIFDVAIPLYNFSAESNSVFGSFQLIDKETLKETSFTSYSRFENHKADWFLYLDLVEYASGGKKWQEQKAELGRIITAIRLVTPNDSHNSSCIIGLNEVVFSTFLRNSNRYHHDTVPTELRVSSLVYSQPLDFTDEHANEVKRILPLLDKELHELMLSLRRFNFSHSREEPEDKLIDLTIALESSLLFGERNELAFRLALRGSAIGYNDYNTAFLNDLFSETYKLRSNIVHGGESWSDCLKRLKKFLGKYDLGRGDFIGILREATRSVLLRVAALMLAESSRHPNSKQPKVLKKVVEAIDSQVVANISNCFSTDSGGNPNPQESGNN